MPSTRPPAGVRFRVPLTLVPYLAGIGTAIPLWGDRAEKIFFSTAAEVIALGAVAMALQGGFFRVSRGRPEELGGGAGMATILIAVGVGLAFAFGALARADGGAAPHLAMTAGALAMGVSAFAIQAFFGSDSAADERGVV